MTSEAAVEAFRLLRARDVAAIDAAAAQAGASGAVLMDRAGAAVAQATLTRFREARRVEVWAGPGKNGGDGWVAALRLKQARREVKVRSLRAPSLLTGESQAAFSAYQQAGGVWDQLSVAAPDADLLIDALFGVGLTRPLEGLAAEAVAALRRGPQTPVLAVDVPSGVDADTGRVLGAAVQADLTVSFIRPKRGLMLGEGGVAAGDVSPVDILQGDPARGAAMAAAPVEAFEIRPETFPANPAVRAPLGHKYANGHVIVASGGFGASGAARMAARAALRVGAGVATVAAPEEAMAECAAQLTSVMLRRADEPARLAELQADERVGALVIGPGHALLANGQGGPSRTAAWVAAVLSAQRSGGGHLPVLVLDADALTCWGDDHTRFFQLCAERRQQGGGVVMTPHLGEFARLFPDLAERLKSDGDKIGAAQAAAVRSQSVLVLKGPDSIVAAPERPVGVHAAFGGRAAPWLATAGAGDVLAGMIAGLAARGWEAFDAACASVWLHVEAARSLGPGCLAEELPDALPQALRRLAAEGVGP